MQEGCEADLEGDEKVIDREKVIGNLTSLRERLKWQKDIQGYGVYISFVDDAIDLLKEQEKLINVDELREKLGFSDNCENCKQNSRHCQYDSHFSLMDFCERLDMAIEELTKEGRRREMTKIVCDRCGKEEIGRAHV